VVKSLGFDSVNLCATLFRNRARLAAENLFLRKQLALFQEREKKARPTTAADRFVLLPARLPLCLAGRVGDRKTRYSHWLASIRLSPLLALEIWTRWKATGAHETQVPDSPNGCRESDLG
jgi:hypothetical protein